MFEFRSQQRMPATILSREEELHWIALRLIPGQGTRTSAKLIERFRSAQTIFRASRRELEGAGVSGAIALSIASGCSFEDAAAQQEMAASGAEVVTIHDPRYPQALRDIFDPPTDSLVCPRMRRAAANALSGGGGHPRPTSYGVAVAEPMAGDLAHAGLTGCQRDGSRYRQGSTQRHAGCWRRHNRGARLRRGRDLSLRKPGNWPRRSPPGG